MSNVIDCRSLTKTFRQGNSAVEVLKNVNLAVAAGETIAIVSDLGTRRDLDLDGPGRHGERHGRDHRRHSVDRHDDERLQGLPSKWCRWLPKRHADPCGDAKQRHRHGHVRWNEHRDGDGAKRHPFRQPDLPVTGDRAA